MKKIIRFSAVAAVLAMTVSCAKEKEVTPVNPVESEDAVFYISASAPESKAYLGEDGVTILWKNGDKIKVNNHNSIGLQEEKNFGETAEFGFTAAEQPEAPFYAVYNATRAYGYGEVGGEHTYKLSLDYNNYTQKWVEDSFDPEYCVLYGSSETAGIQFHHAMAYIKVTPTLGTENVNIARVIIFAKGGEMLSGRMIIDTENGELTAYRDTRDYVTMAGPAEGVALGKSFMIAIPAGTYEQGLKFRFVDVDGNMMEKSTKTFTAQAGVIYPISAVYENPVACPPVATAAEVTSSTACFTWTMGGTATEDAAKEYTIQCSASADFSDATEYTIPTGSASSVWDNNTPKFCFGGLNQNTKYYFRVKNGADAAWSDTVSATTAAYDKTVVSTDANVGDVILAEDFADLAVQAEIVAGAAGVSETGTGFNKHTGSYTIATASATYLPESLKNWGFARGTGSANLYANQGHVKLGTGGAQSYLVTPVLNAIPADKSATLEVTLTLSVYPDANNDLKNVTKFIVSSEKGTMSATNLFTCESAFMNKVEADLTDNKKWVTYTVELANVLQGERLMIAAANNAGNNRLLVNDVKAKIIALDAIVEAPVAKATEVSSSTVSFTWGYATATAAEDANRNYEFGLYKDAACSELVVSYRTPAQTTDKGCWKLRKPKFCFGALQPNTTYYFKVKDTDAEVESAVVSAKTSAFSIVTMPTTAAAAGDVILAEDFSEVFLGGEPVIGAAAACTAYAEANVFETLSGAFPTCVFNLDTDEKALTNATALSGKRLEKWSYAFNSGSSIYAHVGCVKLGTGSNNTWLTTPVLSAIPAGKKADLEITVTLATWSGAVTTGFVYAGNIADKASITTATNVIKSSSVTTSVGAWNTYTITLSGVDNTMRLAIGPDNDTSKTAKGKGRMVVNDVVVKIKALK